MQAQTLPTRLLLATDMHRAQQCHDQHYNFLHSHIQFQDALWYNTGFNEGMLEKEEEKKEQWDWVAGVLDFVLNTSATNDC